MLTSLLHTTLTSFDLCWGVVHLCLFADLQRSEWTASSVQMCLNCTTVQLVETDNHNYFKQEDALLWAFSFSFSPFWSWWILHRFGPETVFLQQRKCKWENQIPLMGSCRLVFPWMHVSKQNITAFLFQIWDSLGFFFTCSTRTNVRWEFKTSSRWSWKRTRRRNKCLTSREMRLWSSFVIRWLNQDTEEVI